MKKNKKKMKIKFNRKTQGCCNLMKKYKLIQNKININ